MQPKSLLLLALALGCGVVASIGISQVLAKRNSGTDAAAPATSVLVPMKNIPMGEPISAQMLKMEPWPEDKVPETAILRMEDIEGRRPKMELIAGMPIHDEQLVEAGANMGGIAASIPPGYRVVPVQVDATSGGASLILPRDRVDVLVLVKRDQTFQQTTARTILQDICVYAVDDVFNMADIEGERSLKAQTISLLLTPSQTEDVMLAYELGKIRLSLRNAEDKEFANVDGSVPGDIFDEGELSNRDLDTTLVRGEKGGSFANFLKGNQQQIDDQGLQTGGVVPQSTQPTDTFRVQMVNAGEVSEVVLESDQQSGDSQDKTGVAATWRVRGGGYGNSAPTTPPAFDFSQPTAGQESTRESTDKGLTEE